ncbi:MULTISPECIES: hypothetical protein [unclassified Streptomyces]|nr:hypothetical protein [Streptomyces sp. 13-12-16]
MTVLAEEHAVGDHGRDQGPPTNDSTRVSAAAPDGRAVVDR